MKRQVSEEQVFEYFMKFIKAGNFPTVAFAARRFSVREDTIRQKVRGLVKDGRLVKFKNKYYLPGDPRLAKAKAEKTGNKKILSPEALKKMSAAGVAGAEALKRRAFETGIARFNPGLAKDAKKIQANIERIVQKAEANGTLHHPRPVFVVLVGEKVG